MHMTTKVLTTREDESIHVAMEKMTNERSRHLPVIRDERLVGLVSIGDMVKHRLAECEKRCESILRPLEPKGTTGVKGATLWSRTQIRGLCCSGRVRRAPRDRGRVIRKAPAGGRYDGCFWLRVGVIKFMRVP